MSRRIRAVLALLALIGFLTGLPFLLVAVNPIGAPRFTWSWDGLAQALLTPDDGTLALTMIKAAGWVCWAILTLAVTLEVIGQLRRVPVPHLRGLGMPQLVAHQLVAAAAILFMTTGPTTTPTTPVFATPAATQPPHTFGAPAAMPEHPGTHHHTGNAGQRHVRVVEEGDTLSQIALDELGDANRYPQIYRATKHTVQPDGRRITDPDLIYVGWKVTIPASGKEPKSEQTPTEQPKRTQDTPTHSPAAPPAPPNPAPTAPPDSSAQVTPTTAPGGTTSQVGETASEADDAPAPPAWLLTGLSGAGAVLAGALWLALVSRRAVQFRSRRPGKTVAAPPPDLAPVEKTLMYQGAPTASLVIAIDETLRRLVARLTADHRPVPLVVGVDATTTHLTLRLRAPADLPEPWQCIDEPDRQVWRVTHTADPELIGPLEVDSPHPWPQLVTVGQDAAGWRLLNLEQLGVISLTGDPLYAADLARYLVAELAISPWSRDVVVDCLGICDELPGLAPARIHHHTGDTAIAGVIATAVATADRLEQAGVDNLETARVLQSCDELWESRALLVTRSDAQHLDVLTSLINDHTGRTASSVLILGEQPIPASLEMRTTGEGHLQIQALGLDLVANGLTEGEARGCAALLAAGQDTTESDIPAMKQAESGEWTHYCDEAGALLEEHTQPRASAAPDISSVLPDPDAEYVAETANTTIDLDTLAPMVHVSVKEHIEATDPTLDADLAEWWADSCPRPRLQVFGPTRVRVGPGGEPGAAASTLSLCTELVAFLGTRPDGVTTQEVADAFNIKELRVRKNMSIVRAWLGVNPKTGRPFMPKSTESERAHERGVGLYQIEGLLSDADLFRRLRLRGESRGADGISDLRTALRLVNGTPYDQLRTRGGYWLADTRIDQHLLCGIVDVAHLIATIALGAGDLRQARAAAELAAMTAPHEATPQLDLAAVAAHEGDPQRAAEIARAMIAWRDGSVEGPVDLPGRAETILRSHRWLEQADRAS